MNAINQAMEKHHRSIIYSLLFVIVFFAASCTFHDIIPVCHYIFGCDHQMHAAGMTGVFTSISTTGCVSRSNQYQECLVGPA